MTKPTRDPAASIATPAEVVFQNDEGDWFFRTESYEYFGPFDTEDRCLAAMEYVKNLDV